MLTVVFSKARIPNLSLNLVTPFINSLPIKAIGAAGVMALT